MRANRSPDLIELCVVLSFLRWSDKGAGGTETVLTVQEGTGWRRQTAGLGCANVASPAWLSCVFYTYNEKSAVRIVGTSIVRIAKLV